VPVHKPDKLEPQKLDGKALADGNFPAGHHPATIRLNHLSQAVNPSRGVTGPPGGQVKATPFIEKLMLSGADLKDLADAYVVVFY